MMNPIVHQPASISPVYIQQPVPPILGEDGEQELSGYFATLYDNRWLILTIAFAVALLGMAYAYLAKPVYEANMLIHVEQESDREAKNLVGEMGQLFDVKTAATSEMELIRSRLVVSSAIDNLKLYISAQPKYFPLVGKAIAQRRTALSNPGLFGLGGYVWGAENVEVSSFEVPDKLLNRNFTLTAEGDGRYSLTESESNILARGTVGTPLKVQTADGPLELLVEDLAAREGAQFSLARSSRLALIEGVQKDLQVAELGKQSGVIGVTLKGNDPQVVHAILAAISDEYMRQNYARKTEEANKTLASINRQLPDMKRQLEQAEAKYNQFRNANGTIDLGEEAKLSLQQSAAAKARKIELEQKRTELMTRFTSNHPIVIGVDTQIKEINNEIRSLATHIKTLPGIEQEVVRLEREVKVNSELYTALLNTAQQLRMVAIGKMSNVRLVDPPMLPEKPVSPNRPQVIAVALMLG
ncbi:MAG: GNVR domain-containing protein, partial [Noviherbaspirillum sp.]